MYCYICGVGLMEGIEVLYPKNIKFFKEMMKKLENKLGKKKYESYCGNINSLGLSHLEECESIAHSVLSYDEMSELKKGINTMNTSKKYSWLTKATLLHTNGKNISIYNSDYWDGYVYDKMNNKYQANLSNDSIPNKSDNTVDGIVVHTDCMKTLKIKNINSLPNKTVNYGFLNNRTYKTQEVPWLVYFLNDVDYVLESPLKNKKNKDRILSLKHNNLIKNGSIKKLKSDRPSPSESATLFKEGTKRKGNDGNMYIIKTNKNGVNKWIKYMSGGGNIKQYKIKYS